VQLCAQRKIRVLLTCISWILRARFRNAVGRHHFHSFPNQQENVTVCANDSDLTLGSSDGILFQIHRRNLEAHSEAFAAEDAFLRRHEVVELSETSQVLDLLLQYIYPQPPPNLGTIDCGLLLALAEAAEKYLFHGVIRVCTTHIMWVLRERSFFFFRSSMGGWHAE
jgi:hypothetical protein